jgi:hypothetical protein
MKTKAATKSKKPQVKMQDIKPKKNPKAGGGTGGRDILIGGAGRDLHLGT